MGEPAHDHGPRYGASVRYERHRSEETVLYRTIAAHWPAFRERTEEHGGLPRFVVREVELGTSDKYLISRALAAPQKRFVP